MPKTWRDIPVEQRETLLALYETNRAALRVEYDTLDLKMAYKSFEAKLREHRNYRNAYMLRHIDSIQIPEPYSRKYLDYETLNGDNFIIISDIEIPDQSDDYLQLALLTAMRHNIKSLVIAGDLIATDQDSLNSWVSTWKTGDEEDYEACVNMTRNMLIEYSRWFDEIVVIEGNHDDRVARKTGGQVHLGMFMHGIPSVKYSRYSYLWLETSRGPVKVVHPQNFSANPVTLGQELYNVEPRKSHVVVAHCHRRQSGMSPDGQFEIHALGTGRDPFRTKYRAKNVNKHKAWDSAFMMIRNGYMHPLDLKVSDWQFWLGDLYEKSPLRVTA